MAVQEFEASTGALAGIRGWLDSELQRQFGEPLATTLRSRVITSVTEWVTNILRHASAPATCVSIEIENTNGSAFICISDDSNSGDPFHNRKIRDLGEISPLETSGRGLAMILAMSDDVDYHPGTGGGTNRLKLKFLGD